MINRLDFKILEDPAEILIPCNKAKTGDLGRFRGRRRRSWIDLHCGEHSAVLAQKRHGLHPIEHNQLSAQVRAICRIGFCRSRCIVGPAFIGLPRLLFEISPHIRFTDLPHDLPVDIIPFLRELK